MCHWGGIEVAGTSSALHVVPGTSRVVLSCDSVGLAVTCGFDGA